MPTPRGGGVGIAVTGLVGFIWLGIAADASWLLIGAGLLLVSAIGWWDDHRALPVLPRLLAHVFAGACLATGLLLQQVGMPTAVAAFLLTPALVNAWNFMDGIDGLAASQAALCAAGLALLLTGPAQWLALLVFGACLGFLPLNFPKARVFLGDVGSGAAGYLVAVLVFLGVANIPGQAGLVLLLAPSAFLVDSGLTLLLRVIRGDTWWRPHVEHVYQRMSRKLGHPLVTLVYAGWTVVAIGAMLVLHRTTSSAAVAGALAMLVTAILLWRLLYRRYAKTEGIGV